LDRKYAQAHKTNQQQPRCIYEKHAKRTQDPKLNLYTLQFRMMTRYNGLVVSVLGIRALGPGFDSRVVPLFHLV